MVKIMENPYFLMDDLGGFPIFLVQHPNIPEWHPEEPLYELYMIGGRLYTFTILHDAFCQAKPTPRSA